MFVFVEPLLENQRGSDFVDYFFASLAGYVAFDQDIFRGDGGQALILEEDGQLIATGGLIAFPIPPSFFKPKGRNGYILNMYTIPARRHQGFAAKVLQLLQDTAKEEGFEVIYLRTSEWGRPAYEKAGFQACGDWMDWTVR